jgi:hypothetical protein
MTRYSAGEEGLQVNYILAVSYVMCPSQDHLITLKAVCCENYVSHSEESYHGLSLNNKNASVAWMAF